MTNLNVLFWIIFFSFFYVLTKQPLFCKLLPIHNCQKDVLMHDPFMLVNNSSFTYIFFKHTEINIEIGSEVILCHVL